MLSVCIARLSYRDGIHSLDIIDLWVLMLLT